MKQDFAGFCLNLNQNNFPTGLRRDYYNRGQIRIWIGFGLIWATLGRLNPSSTRARARALLCPYTLQGCQQ